MGRPRQVALLATLALTACGPTIRYLPGSGRGTLSGNVITLDNTLPRREREAELAHLLVHFRDRLGDGCARGLAAALDSEARARAVESALRATWQLGPGPVGGDAEADYRERCTK